MTSLTITIDDSIYGGCPGHENFQVTRIDDQPESSYYISAHGATTTGKDREQGYDEQLREDEAIATEYNMQGQDRTRDRRAEQQQHTVDKGQRRRPGSRLL